MLIFSDGYPDPKSHELRSKILSLQLLLGKVISLICLCFMKACFSVYLQGRFHYGTTMKPYF